MPVSPVQPDTVRLRRTLGIVVFTVICSLIGSGLMPGYAKDLPGMKALTDFQDVFVDLAEHVKPAVVNISTSGGDPLLLEAIAFARSAGK